MTKEKWQRARSDLQKQERIDTALEAAGTLFDEMLYEDITLAQVAKEAGFTRSNLYLYFQNKDELYLHLMQVEIVKWWQDIEYHFDQQKPCEPDNYARFWVDILLQHNRLLRLVALPFTLLEKHASIEKLVEFKKTVHQIMEQHAELLESCFSFRDEGAAHTFYLASIAVASGLYSMTHHTLKQQQAMTMLEMSFTPPPYRQMLQNAIESLLRSSLN